MWAKCMQLNIAWYTVEDNILNRASDQPLTFQLFVWSISYGFHIDEITRWANLDCYSRLANAMHKQSDGRYNQEQSTIITPCLSFYTMRIIS